jgi:hypothetical protein
VGCFTVAVACPTTWPICMKSILQSRDPQGAYEPRP